MTPKPARSKPFIDEQPLFSGFTGVAKTPAPEVFEAARRNNPEWVQLLEKAYEQFATMPENAGIYADPKGKGATLEQSYLVLTIFGVEPYCLLARPVLDKLITRIRHVVRSTSAEVVETLKKIQAGSGEINASTLHFDGKTGHCICLTSYDPQRDRFVYHDPWPENSLLCRENNMAGVDAQPDEGKLWSVTADELQRVIYASFVFPHMWARLQGVQFDLLYEDWKKGGFYGFFHLKLMDERSENSMHRRLFGAGPFKDSVTVMIDSTDKDKIVRATLIMDKKWMIANFSLALDVAKSFVKEFAPSPERERFEAISAAMWNLRDPQFMVSIKDKNPKESETTECIHAFMGSVESASVSAEFATLSFKNIAYEDQHLQEMEYTLL